MLHFCSRVQGCEGFEVETKECYISVVEFKEVKCAQ